MITKVDFPGVGGSGTTMTAAVIVPEATEKVLVFAMFGRSNTGAWSINSANIDGVPLDPIMDSIEPPGASSSATNHRARAFVGDLSSWSPSKVLSVVTSATTVPARCIIGIVGLTGEVEAGTPAVGSSTAPLVVDEDTEHRLLTFWAARRAVATAFDLDVPVGFDLLLRSPGYVNASPTSSGAAIITQSFSTHYGSVDVPTGSNNGGVVIPVRLTEDLSAQFWPRGRDYAVA